MWTVIDEEGRRWYVGCSLKLARQMQAALSRSKGMRALAVLAV